MASERVERVVSFEGKQFSIYFKNSPDWMTQHSIVQRPVNRHEPEVVRYLLRNLERGMTFLDVGAGVGWFTLIGAHEVGSEGKVLAYESLPSRCELLKENVELNGFLNVRCFPLALSDKDGTAYIGGSRQMTIIEKRTGIPIKTVRLDSHLRGLDLSRLDIVKIDVEGAELRVLRGMKETIENSAGIKIVCEVHSNNALRRYGDTRERLFKFISRLGLHTRRIGGDNHWVFF